jgi:hypothetical protein
LGYPPSGPGAEIGDGEPNTVGIDTASCATGTDAAVICADLFLNGFDDWFLPSIKELNLVRNVLYLKGFGNFDDGTYWSSTEALNTVSHHVEFLSGVPYSWFDKNNMLHVRAIRSLK